MDCVRAVDFICTLPQADLDKIVVEGASQGGALTFATAALNYDRIRLCVPQVPFLSDFPHYFKVASWPGNEFYNYVEVEKKETWDEVFRTLSYFDIKNLAPWIKAPC
jgi:cephalosporin-C deacetylase-like acetyl esterase